jgi:hypothetical protein
MESSGDPSSLPSLPSLELPSPGRAPNPRRDLIEVGGGVGASAYRARSRGWNLRNYDIFGEALDFAAPAWDESYEVDASKSIALLPGSADVVAMW